MLIRLNKLHDITNDSFVALHTIEDRYLVLYGGADSGKSRFASQKLVLRTINDAHSGLRHRWLVVRKTQPAIRKSAFELMKSTLRQFGIYGAANITLSPMRFALHDFCDTEFLFEGLDDPEKLKSIEGITGVWLEEATELTFEDFMQIDLRLRGQTPSYKQIILSFNPVSAESWIKKTSGFFDKPTKTSRIKDVTPRDYPAFMRRLCMNPDKEGAKTYATLHHSTVLDNQFIDPQDIEILDNLKDKDENFYKIYRLGEWGILKGLVYSGWIQEPEGVWPTEFQQRCYGLDFGFSNNPSAMVEVGFTNETNLWIRECLYERQLTNPMIAERAKYYVDNNYADIIADSAEPKSIVELRQLGLPILQSVKGPDSVRNGIQRIQQYTVHVHADAVNVWKEYHNYKWAEDKDGNAINKPVDYMSHIMDAIRYAVAHLRGKAKAGLIVSSKESYDDQKKQEKVQDDPNRPVTIAERAWHEWINDDEDTENE